MNIKQWHYVTDFCSCVQRWRKGKQKTKCSSVRKHFTYKLVWLIHVTIKWFTIPEGESDGQKASTFTITYEPTTHRENIRQSLLDAPITGKYGDKEVVLKTVTMFSTYVAKQQTTVPKTKNNLAKVAVLLQHDFAFFDTEHLSNHSEYNTQ